MPALKVSEANLSVISYFSFGIVIGGFSFYLDISSIFYGTGVSNFSIISIGASSLFSTWFSFTLGNLAYSTLKIYFTSLFYTSMALLHLSAAYLILSSKALL